MNKSMCMWFVAIGAFKGGLAHYRVVSADAGIFRAFLMRYDGKAVNDPPKEMILVRGENGWSSNVEGTTLPAEIGRVIDRRTKGRLSESPGAANSIKIRH